MAERIPISLACTECETRNYKTTRKPPGAPGAKKEQLVMKKFQEIDINKDGQLDRVELTAYAVKQFIEMDVNKDRFLTEEEFKKAQEAESKKMRAMIQAMQPAQPAAQPQPAPAPQGLAPGLPQGTR